MQDDIKLRVSVETQQSEQNVDNLNKKIDQTQDKVEDLNKEVGKTGTASIGAWGNAFEKALDTVDKEAGALGGNLKEVTGSLKQAVPLIKNVNSTAIKGLTGVKAAIAATGIGALILAITTIISHWEGFTKAVGISEDKFKEFKQTVLDVLSNIVSGVVGVGNVILQALLTPIRSVIEAFKGLGNVVKDVFTGNWSNIKKDAETAARGIGESFRKGFNISENFQAGKEAGKKFLDGVHTMFTYSKEEEEVTEAAGNLGSKAGKKFAEKAQKEVEKISEGITKSIKDYNKTLEKLQEDILKERRQAGISEEYLGLLSPEQVAKVDEIRQKLEEYREAGRKFVEEMGPKEEELRKIIDDETASLEERNEALQELERLTKAYLQVAKNLEIVEENLQQEESDFINQVTDELLSGNLQKFLDDQQDILNQGLSQSLHTWHEYLGALSEVGANVGSIFDSMVEAQKNQIEMDQKLGKISEEEAKKRFQQLKGYEIAANWINTLAGVANVVASPEGRAGVLGWAIQATQIAAIIAAGIARDRQIRNSYIDNPDMGGSGNGGMAGATPLQVMSDITPSPTMNIPVSSEDTRVYILESDIVKSQNRVKIREENTTF